MCNCEVCKKHELDKAKEVNSCKCYCHGSKECISHDSLCCSTPNMKHIEAKRIIEKYRVKSL